MGLLKSCAISSAFFVTFLAVSISILWIWLGYEHIPNRVADVRTLQNESFDFIIVGAGTAGCVLANRLSANGNVSVLLIEAGDVFGAASIIPLFSTAMQQTRYDWAFRTTPQKYSSRGLINNQQFLPRGRGLGGSGQINYMLHFTGIAEDFDRWERLGALDWGHEQLKPYLEQHEEVNGVACDAAALEDDEIFEQNQYPSLLPTDAKSSLFQFCSSKLPSTPTDENHSPKLHITRIDNLLSQAFTQAPSDLPGGAAEYSFNAARYTIRRGIRWSSYHEYLRPAFGRSNLHILTGVIVQKVLFDHENRAVGVAVSDNEGNQIEIRAHKEVILSAGAFQTPQLLKLSGVGPAIELKRHRIPLVHDSPNVGQNYFDHMNLPLFVSINATASVTLDKVLSVKTAWDYLKHGTGVLSTTAVAGIGSPRGGAKFGVILFGMGSVDEQALRHVSNMKQDAFRAFFPLHHNTSQEGFLFLSTCHQPRSRGAIFLRDRQPHSPPFINPNYLKDYADIECMSAAIRLAAQTIDTEPFRRMGAQIHWPKLRSCSNFGPFEEDFRTNRPSQRYLECILRVSALTGHHPGGTAAIGLHAEAPVDNRLRVNGVRGLRVVDASVFPAPVSGTPNSVVIAVAERAGDIILRDLAEG